MIKEDLYFKIINLYDDWRDLNDAFQSIEKRKIVGNNVLISKGRGINMHESISEIICCYVNDFEYVTKSSEDAVDPKNGDLVQIKSSSNWNSDLTSFGPTSVFDQLHFLRLKRSDLKDEFYLYKIPIDELYDIKVNMHQTFRDQQLQNRRPRFSIINKYIKKYNIEPYAIVNMENGDITMLD